MQVNVQMNRDDTARDHHTGPHPTTDEGEKSPVPGFPLRHDEAEVAALLADDRRRAIYLYVKGRHSAVTVNEVAEEFGIHRNAAKFHLDKLLDAGLLTADYRRLNGRRGPGAGRPSKLYSTTGVEVAFTVPERHYDLLAHLLLQALTSGRDLDEVGEAFGREVAASLGPDAEDPLEGVRDVLERLGFEPHVEVDDDGRAWVTTENCPFGRVATEDPEGEVCRLDRAIIRGVLDVYDVGGGEVREHASLRRGHEVCVREVTGFGSRASG